ncbi:nucleoside-diphosphate sugar epimerase/dehydratase [Cohnella phaseoli]|uniref:FlaA1/EpsC-like NDP-sugar epimerase n=1 Tax=Cohnella phaseoli TaxID=456490 RepID=A0A3D9KCN8_9BACL|nr:nucleoside-diphosphate sugar epimerase/dehydratase [Cohnella phaseoli]RED84042.1 FlaA1/EpsC-like NDP-sugar epimerase [Cohnella phaseoli]
MNSNFRRIVIFILIDTTVVCLSIFLAYLIRFDFETSSVNFAYIEYVMVSLSLLTIGFNIYFRVYRTIWKFASLGDYISIFKGAVFASACFYIVHHLAINSIAYHYFSRYITVPRSTTVLSFAFILVGILMSRVLTREIKGFRGKIQKHHRRTLIVGAGEAGMLVIKELNNTNSESYPVVIVDDDVTKVGYRMNGILVAGKREDIPSLVNQYHIQDIILAIPSTSRVEQASILQICKTTGCKIKIMPKINDLIDGRISLNLIKNVEVEDLLGRDPIIVDLRQVTGYIKDKVVLVTGAGGSIGSELCRQCAKFSPRTLLLLGHGENSIYEIEFEMKRKFPNLQIETLIVDIQDRIRLNSVFEKYRPNVVFHAAAHKHVPLMEKNPAEAIKNNIFGTKNVAECSDTYQVERFVMISTDKAVNPTNVMGATKRAAEMLILQLNEKSQTDFVAVRFGNVLGSRGSVIPIFKKQIEAGGPITVTHPEMVRYFMTIPEAVQLVIQAGALATGGEIFILDMGQPVKISDLAYDLIRLSGMEPGEDIKVEYTGIRPGEKLFEEILTNDEGAKTTKHDRIFIGKPSEESYARMDFILKKLEQLVKSSDENNDELIRQQLANLVPTYKRDSALSSIEEIKDNIRSSIEVLATVEKNSLK